MTQSNSKATLSVTRFLWAAMIGSVLMVGSVLLFSKQSNTPPQVHKSLVYPAIGILGAMLLLGLTIRNAIWKNGRSPEGLVNPKAYANGILVHMMMLDLAATVSLVFAYLTRQLHPYLLLAGIALLLMLFNFPTGKPMFSDGAD